MTENWELNHEIPYPFCTIVILWAALSQPTLAQAVCGDRTKIVDRLESTYQEKATAFGLIGDSSVIELYVSDTGSWTLLITYPTGVSCLIAAGDNWEFMLDPKFEKKVKEYVI